MTFRGWPVEALEFYEGLEADNSKAYWQDHKQVYEQIVRAPMDELLRELAPEFGEGRIFRPYRDVRFRKDSPQFMQGRQTHHRIANPSRRAYHDAFDLIRHDIAQG